ncbi:MAG: NAD(P)H-dependent oxidoreductase [Steroidobacteraceae bacterium]|nr:NAD(P)H-dependent oxidoreductase [Steroidobacteraceae bacterium]MDW8259693.1 NAD(P)H-dependent oxidoreductase [Gammaproteobacteria bacterium]
MLGGGRRCTDTELEAPAGEENTMSTDDWLDVGPIETFPEGAVREVALGRTRVAISRRGNEFGAVSGICNHVGGPLGQGTLDGEYIVCPWHYWKFHRLTGIGEPGYEEDRVPSHATRVEHGRLLVQRTPRSQRGRKPHAPHPLARTPERSAGPIRVLGLSTTAMTPGQPRYSTSEDLLQHALTAAAAERGCETQLLRIRELRFRECEGFYSKAARACTWPCSITQMDPGDQMERVYEGVVHWADVILIATPIRWGAPSSLYFKMIERMNCIQNQETIANKHLLRNKVAGFIITGGQDNVQAVAGQMLSFFTEIGCQFPQFPFIAHSRGWSAEDMERNQQVVQQSASLRAGAAALAQRCIAMAEAMITSELGAHALVRGGRKAHALGEPAGAAG